MATYAYTFTSGDTVTPTKLNNARSVSEIVNADIKSNAAIAGTKIAPDFGEQNVVTSGALQITSDGASEVKLSRASTNTSASQITFAKARNTQSSKQVVAAGDNSGLIRFNAYDGSADIECARIQASIDGTPGSNDMPGRLIFSTTADGDSSVTERMRITNAGNVGIANTSPSEKLDVTGNIKVSGSSVFGGQVRVPFGSVGTPGLSFDGDGDTGIIRPGSDEISFVTDSSERMRITSAGNVGIANTSPSEKLDVTGNIKASGTAVFGGQLRVPFGTSATPGMSFDGDSDTGIIRSAADELSFVTGGSQAVCINASNSVGIGVTTIDASCLLQMSSATKGFRPPVMTTTQRNAISSPATGLIVFNTTTKKINVYNGSAWEAVTSA